MSGIGVVDAVVLGVVEGLTEFLPVSSTAHLKVVESILGHQTDDDAVVGFTAVIQVGAIAAVLVYFVRDIVRIARAWLQGLVRAEARNDRDYRFGWWIIFATVPLVVVGVAAKSLIEGPLASLWVVAGSLLAGSAYIALAEHRTAKRAGQGRPEERTTFADAMIIGSSQILALLLPGFSRSGASISTGLLRGIDRVAATRLSFFLSIPALVGAGAYELKDAVGGGNSGVALVVGTVTSFAVAYVVVAWFLRFVARHDFQVFIWYRIGLAIVVVACLATGALSA